MKIMSGIRWWVIALVALATVINYIDRQSLNVLWPAISADLYPDKTADERKQIYAFISVVFVFSYAFGQAIFGKIFDKIGTRLGFNEDVLSRICRFGGKQDIASLQSDQIIQMLHTGSGLTEFDLAKVTNQWAAKTD